MDGTETWYTPEGTTALEIMEIPDAKKLFSDEDGANSYIELMAREKKKHREKGLIQD